VLTIHLHAHCHDSNTHGPPPAAPGHHRHPHVRSVPRWSLSFGLLLCCCCCCFLWETSSSSSFSNPLSISLTHDHHPLSISLTYALTTQLGLQRRPAQEALYIRHASAGWAGLGGAFTCMRACMAECMGACTGADNHRYLVLAALATPMHNQPTVSTLYPRSYESLAPPITPTRTLGLPSQAARHPAAADPGQPVGSLQGSWGVCAAGDRERRWVRSGWEGKTGDEGSGPGGGAVLVSRVFLCVWAHTPPTCATGRLQLPRTFSTFMQTHVCARCSSTTSGCWWVARRWGRGRWGDARRTVRHLSTSTQCWLFRSSSLPGVCNQLDLLPTPLPFKSLPPPTHTPLPHTDLPHQPLHRRRLQRRARHLRLVALQRAPLPRLRHPPAAGHPPGVAAGDGGVPAPRRPAAPDRGGDRGVLRQGRDDRLPPVQPGWVSLRCTGGLGFGDAQ